MSKNALVLKGMDFSTNKLTTVTLDGGSDKPCTALELSESSKTITALGDFVLTATKTPADTTDVLLWSTSDASVATVENGTVSVVGLGTVTITATCGNQTATCVVDATEITMDVDYGFFQRQGINNYPDLYAYATSKRELLIHSLEGDSSVKTLKNQTTDATVRYPVMLPQNTGVVKLSYGSDMRAGTINFGWIDSTTSSYPSNYPNVAALVDLDNSNSSKYNEAKTWEYVVPEGADSFAISLTPLSVDYSETDTPEGIAQAKGIVVKCAVASQS